MNKVEQFKDFLTSIRFSYRQCNDYHIQINKVHNFYPTSNSYYNSNTGHKEKYSDFENRNQFEQFLIKNQPSEYFELTEELKPIKDIDSSLIELQFIIQKSEKRLRVLELAFISVVILTIIALIFHYVR